MIEQRGAEFTRRVEFRTGWHDTRPKGTGMHGMELDFVLVAADAAVEFTINTEWLPKTVERAWSRGRSNTRSESYGVEVRWHSVVQRDKSDYPSLHCRLLGNACWSTSSGLLARDWFPEFVTKGEDWLWQQLESEVRKLQAEIEQIRRDVRQFS